MLSSGKFIVEDNKLIHATLQNQRKPLFGTVQETERTVQHRRRLQRETHPLEFKTDNEQRTRAVPSRSGIWL
jgi:hypothetical protein